MIQITTAWKALIVYELAIGRMIRATDTAYKAAQQHKANVAMGIYLRTRNMPYLADRLPSAPPPCEKCDGRGTIEGAMEFSWVGGYPDTRVYVCDCMIEDSEDVPF